MWNLFVYVGFRYLKMKPIRSLLTVVGISLGVALFIGIRIINQSTLNSFQENIEAVAGKATLSVSAGDSGFSEDRLSEIQKVPGVKAAVPLVENRAYFKAHQAGVQNQDGVQTVMVLGVDLLKEQAVRTYKTTDEQIIDDPLTFLNQPDSIIITHEFAKERGFQLGSQFELATARGVQKFTVRGLLSPAGPAKAFGGGIAIMDIDGARMTFGKEGKLDRVDLLTQSGVEIAEVQERLQKVLGPGFKVERPASRTESLEKMVKSYQTMMSFFSTLALLVGVFLVFNSITISVAERKREIGVLRALGATRKGILSLFLVDAFFMGVLGSLLGAGLGRILARLLIGMVSETMTAQYLTPIQVSRLVFGPKEILLALAVGAFSALLAAVWPAYRATLIDPIEAMKRNESASSAPSQMGLGGGERLANALGGGLTWIALAMLGFVQLTYFMNWPQRYPLIESLNEGLSMLGATLFGPAIVRGLIWLLKPILTRRSGPVVRLAQDSLLRNPRRTSSNVMSLMVGLILVILVSAVNVSFRKTLMNWFNQVLKSDLIVSSNGQVISYQTQPLHEDLAKEIEKVPGVQQGKGFGVYGLRFLHMTYQNKPVGVKAYDEPDPAIHYSTLEVLDRPTEEAGYELYHSPDPVVLISENFALHFGKKRGDTIELTSPEGIVQFKVVGVLIDFASDVGVLYMNRALYKRIWKDPLVSAFGVQVVPGADLQKIRKEMDLRFGSSHNLLVTSNSELRQQMTDLIDRSFKDSKAIELAALLVGLLGLFNTLLVSVMERMREIGILRAVGMSRVQLSRMILVEGLLQGGLGAIASMLLGVWIAYNWITHSFSHVLGWIVKFYFPWESLLVTFATGIGVAWIASLYPAKRAANLEITEALEYE